MSGGVPDVLRVGRTDHGGDSHPRKVPQMPATALQLRLKALLDERILARRHGLADDGAYMADLDDEIAEVGAAYTGAAVTEIAMLRAAFLGRQVG